MNPVTLEQFHALSDRLGQEGRLEFTIVTPSMEPLIPVGALVEVAPLHKTPERFSIIVFLDPEKKLVCHFVWSANPLSLSKDDPEFVTISLRSADPYPVPRSRILGQVRNFELTRAHKLRVLRQRLVARLGGGRR